MTQDELKLVLDALKWCHGGEPCGTAEAIAVIEKALAQPKQKPVAWRWENGGKDKWLNKYIYLDNGAPDYPEECEPLYTTQPQRTWQGLTAGEILDALISVDEKTVRLPSMLGQFACAIEAKLKEKNNG